MSDPKRLANRPEEAGAREDGAVLSYVRAHDVDAFDLPRAPPPLVQNGFEESDVTAFLDDWLGRHFAMSVKLHDVQRAREGDDPELAATLNDLGIAQGVLLELHEYASSEPRLHAMMRESRSLQHGVAAVYAWLDETLATLSERAIARRRASFVDDEELPPISMLHTLERLHPDLQRIVRAEGLPVDGEVARKLSLCFRQIGATIVRISGRASMLPPPHA